MGMLGFVQGKLGGMLSILTFGRYKRDETPGARRLCKFGHAVFAGNNLCTYGHHAA